MSIKRVLALIFAAAIVALSVASADLPPPLSAAEIPDAALRLSEPAAGRLWSFLALPEVRTILLGAVSAVAGLLLRWRWVRNWRLERAVQCLAAGVRETYEEYVREIQKASVDGKLTAEERDKAMNMALEKAKSYAMTEGFELAKVYAKEFLPVLVERLIGLQKATGRGLPFEPLLPELEPR